MEIQSTISEEVKLLEWLGTLGLGINSGTTIIYGWLITGSIIKNLNVANIAQLILSLVLLSYSATITSIAIIRE